MGTASALDGATGVFMNYSSDMKECAVKKSSASEILDMLEGTLSLAENVLDRTKSKLEGVMVDSQVKQQPNVNSISSMPPYFEALRQKIENLQFYLDSISDCVSRTDI